MRLTVNDEPAELPAGTTVADLVGLRAPGHRRVAVARNGQVVPRSGWGSALLVDGDRLELLVAVAGG